MKKLFTFFLALAASVGMSWAMQIYIDVPEQDLLTLEVEPSDDIAVVKAKIEDKTSILVADQTLYFNSTLLEDDKTLAYYDIQDESTLTLVISGGEEEEGDAIVINTNEVLSGYTKETITITCQNSGDAQGFKLSGSYTASISNSDVSKHIEKIELVPGFYGYNHNKVRANGVEPISSGEELITFLNVNSNEVTLSSSEIIQIEKVKITLGDGAPIVYTVALKDGTVNADKVTLSATEAAENTTITVTPDMEYEITAFKATYNTTEEAASTLDPGTGVYSFTMPAANVTIEATIAAKPAPEGDIFENFTATAGSGGYDNEGHAKLVDGKYRESEYTKWCTDGYFKSVPTGESGDACWWIDFEASNPLNLTGYILTTGDHDGRFLRNPKDWVIKAKLNADDAWTTIATVTNNTTMEDKKFKDYIFSLNQSGTYKYFRFEVLATQGSDLLELSELRLIGSVYVPLPTDESGAYVLSNADEWNLFAGLVNTGYEDFEGKNVVQTADFTVSTMAGSSDEHAFRGHYESRNGAALTFNYTDDGDEDFCAPFRFIDGASFEGLQVKGTIVKYKKKNAAGFAGKALGENTFTNCRSSVDIQADTDGDGSHGGFVGDLRGGTCSFSNCVFDGKMRGINGATSRTYNWGGFVSWVASGCTANFEKCLFIPSEINISNLTETNTYARKAENGKVNVTNCYYTEQMGIARGTKAYALTADENISVENAGQKGFWFGNALYAGKGEVLTLRLSNTAGYNAYKANEEDIIVSEGMCTYTMPNADVLITGVTWPTIVFEDTNLGTRKEVNVQLPHKFVSDCNTNEGEWDQILKTLYSFYGWCKDGAKPTATGNEAVTAGLEGNNHYVLIDHLFEGTATVTGTFHNELPSWDFSTYTVTIYVKKESDTPTAIDEVGNDERANGEWTKVLRDGQIYIIRDGKTYNIMGTLWQRF